MKRSRSFEQQLFSHWLRARHRRRIAATLGGTLALGGGLGSGVADAALVTIDTAQATTQQVADGDSLEITDAGSITTATGDGVIPSASRGAIGGIANDGSIDVGGDGVRIDGGTTLTGSISNTGSISASGATTEPSDGIEVSGTGSVVTGDISNAGTISAEIDGIDVSYSGSVQGSITNSGTISAGDGGIELDSYASVGGNITNSGTIDADYGVNVWTASKVTGNVTNASGGQITARLDGIYVYDSTVEGQILNQGTITGGDIFDDVGILLSSSASVQNGISNSGTISAYEGGIGVYSYSSVVGGIANSGTINAGDEGIDVYGSSDVQGGISNSGTIHSLWGIWATSSTVSGGITNAAGGIIDTGDTAIGITDSQITGDITNANLLRVADQGSASSYGNAGIWLSSASTVDGNIVNAEGGIIDTATNGGDHGIGMTGSSMVTGEIRNAGELDVRLDGIRIAGGSSVDGAVSNSVDGAITAGQAAIHVASDAAVAGGISNAGTLQGALHIFGTDGDGGGINVTNTGQIDIGTTASYISGDFSQPGSALAITLLTFGDYTEAPLTLVGDAEIGGELLLGFDPSFSFTPSARLTLIDIGGTRTGLFDTYADDALVRSFGAGRDIFIDYTDDGDIALYSSSVPIPGTAALIGLGLFGWRLRHRQVGGKRCARRHV